MAPIKKDAVVPKKTPAGVAGVEEDKSKKTGVEEDKSKKTGVAGEDRAKRTLSGVPAGVGTLAGDAVEELHCAPKWNPKVKLSDQTFKHKPIAEVMHPDTAKKSSGTKKLPPEYFHLANQRKKFIKLGYAHFQDQHDIEKEDQAWHAWLHGEKIVFQHAAEQAKGEFDEFVEKNEKEKDMKKLVEEVKNLSNHFEETYKLRNVLFGNGPESLTSVKDLDFRAWKVIYSTKKTHQNNTHQNNPPTKKTHQKKTHQNNPPQGLRELEECLWGNLHVVVPVQADDWGTKLTEISLMAWGTAQQQMHWDYCGTQKSKMKYDGWYDTPPENFFGTLMYHFKNTPDGTPLEEGDGNKITFAYDEVAMAAKSDKTKPRKFRTEIIPEGHVCIFGGAIKHSGGVNKKPYIRMHVHFDPPGNRRHDYGKLESVGEELAKKQQRQLYVANKTREYRAKKKSKVSLPEESKLDKVVGELDKVAGELDKVEGELEKKAELDLDLGATV